ncbi:hypothetical protein BKA58DRAFT_401660 [Alternaria rosae]|uniref:uncharacterized protein n=1 Tax=Alternaria rosae TaxID=1187941 RepID=UPI001E8EACAC|nr:uncharacterized protein BKA58DRAFT_401660 [Alternaria rosae]KAH6870082.1 hypothetical protein BKA58DRAFT_401660 [Alternaria rosae]
MEPLYNTRETFSKTALYTPPHITPSAKDASPPVCPICTEPCTELCIDVPTIGNHHALQMPLCAHIFGASCIETWFDAASTCPLCRKDFFPTNPEGISQELKEMPGLVEEALGVLQKMRDRYPQGRDDLEKIASSVGGFAEMIVRDCEERDARKSEREEFEGRRHQKREALATRERQRQDNSADGQTSPPNETPTAPFSDTTMLVPPVSTPTAAPQQEVPPSVQEYIMGKAEAFILYNFTRDLSSVTRTGHVDPDSDFYHVMDLARVVQDLAEEYGLLEVATAISRKRINVNRGILEQQRAEEELRRASCVEYVGGKVKRRGFWRWSWWRR